MPPLGRACEDRMMERIDVVVEIPRGTRNKYELDHVTGRIRLDRRLFSATVYPAEYGFVDETLGEDGDPLDAMVILDEPTFPGCVIGCRPVGVFWMEDDAGPDAKIICVVGDDPRWDHVQDIGDLPEHLRKEIEHFFTIYKALEPGKWADVRGFEGAAEAKAEITRSLERAKGL
jgi:inorganic pyrophosphatase